MFVHAYCMWSTYILHCPVHVYTLACCWVRGSVTPALCGEVEPSSSNMASTQRIAPLECAVCLKHPGKEKQG